LELAQKYREREIKQNTYSLAMDRPRRAVAAEGKPKESEAAALGHFIEGVTEGDGREHSSFVAVHTPWLHLGWRHVTFLGRCRQFSGAVPSKINDSPLRKWQELWRHGHVAMAGFAGLLIAQAA
jgi:hypothetical protein